MLVAIDASRTTVARRTGTEAYSLHIIRGLIEVGGGHRFRLYFRDNPPDGLLAPSNNVEIKVIHRKRLWTHTGLRQAVLRDRPDVLFVPAHVIPWPGVGGVPSVVTTHDLGYLHYPDRHPFLHRLYLDWSTRHSATTACRVIAVSQATAHDLMTLASVPQEKIRVVYSGVNGLHPVKDTGRVDALRERLGIPGPYLLHVGSIQPRKNLVRLVEAFAEVQNVIEGLSLVLAGQWSWGYRHLSDRVEALSLSERVVMPGYVADEDLPALYSGAAVYAFPSLYEGFGFPVLEAMACGTPVVCANTSSLPELVGNAALTVAPTDGTGLAEALRRVLTDPALRKELVTLGFKRVKLFTWAACARATLDVLLEAASTRRVV